MESRLANYLSRPLIAEILARTVDVHVGLLRQKLEDDAKNPRYFLTMRGFGYKFIDQNR